ncbi:AGE family epimerase/isomerase [Caulobacter rhizosphaerae]|jgi:mannose-6-phosphate isomerase|uniref:Mannose-6-phosphate isomerase n=1 Tax=Caulobacter rhizosphaerae TaxID=2010972 RepID=A0ABU1N1P4_9CAUL|nr:AGE family epimerase/isomerase [Caulobacter rhizosphaerae]MDR6532337.1 mannose-6-phosphate isomerase [Caulobacter rhizosphaerae]GGL22715.1 AGE family epimerase/isomerase [Caulobacter rhizosphaerae]
MTDDFARLVRLRDDLKAWALDHAFPVWWEIGADKVQGGFFEKIALDGTPVEAPRRARVQPRQIYSYAVAGLLGWDGPWKQALEHGLDFYLSKYRRPDGFMRTLVASDGSPLDDKVDLYDQAFGLFGLAMASSVLPERADLPALATSLRDALYATLKHPIAGFEESVPRSLPLLSNPHMHLFEASLAWVEAGGDPQWRAMADEIAELALSKFIDPKSGGLREYYDGDWNPAPGVDGRIIEPGHQFEWAWLLLRWGKLAGRDDAIAAALRMIAIGDGPGVDPARGVAIFALLDDMSVHDDIARLWAQTEQIKAGVLAAQVTGDARWWTTAANGAEALTKYFDVPVKGLWRDKLRADGTFVDEAAPASSFYHIVCAILELDRAVKAMS